MSSYRVFSSCVVSGFLSLFLKQVDEQINDLQFVKENMNNYSSSRLIKIINEIGDQLLNKPHQTDAITNDRQPHKIGVDNLMALTNSESNQQRLSKQPSFGNETGQKISVINKRVDKERKQEKLEDESIKTENLCKLLTQLQNEDEQITEIRKQIIKKQQEQRLYQVQRSKKEQYDKNYKKNSVNFDYNGDLIEIKGQKRKNLISGMVVPSLAQDNKQNGSNQRTASSKVTYVQTHKVKANQQNEKKPKKKKQTEKVRKTEEIKIEQKPDIQFSRIVNPLEKIEVKEGVKATFDKSILEKKKKELISEQIASSKSNRKLSKRQYSKLKSHTIRKNPQQEEFDTQPIVNEQIPEQKKFVRENKEHPEKISIMKQRAKTQIEAFKVHVGDVYLKKELLQKVKETENIHINKKVLDPQARPDSDIKKKIDLNQIDKYNLQYSRNRTQYSSIKKGNQHPERVLPKINLKQHPSHPKLRQKLKDGSALRRQVFKKFQESLRI